MHARGMGENLKTAESLVAIQLCCTDQRALENLTLKTTKSLLELEFEALVMLSQNRQMMGEITLKR